MTQTAEPVAIRTSEDPLAGINAVLYPKETVDLRAADYDRAAQLIRERGLHRGSSHGEGGALCAGVAVITAASERFNHDRALTVSGSGIARDMDLPDEFVAVQQWNDVPERTQDEVLERLEHAANKLRELGRA